MNIILLRLFVDRVFRLS